MLQRAYLETYRVHTYDPRGEFDSFLGIDIVTHGTKNYTENAPFVRYRTPRQAVLSAREHGGILILEELMTIPKQDFQLIREASVGRRHDDEGTANPIFIYGASQRPVHVPKEIIDLSDEIYLFRLLSRKDISHVSHLIPRDMESRIPNLKQGEHFHIVLS